MQPMQSTNQVQDDAAWDISDCGLSSIAVQTIAINLWNEMYEDIDRHTRHYNMTTEQAVREFAPLVICELMRYASQRKML